MKAFAALGQIAAHATLARRGGADQLDFLAAELEREPAKTFGGVFSGIAQRLTPQHIDEQPPGGRQIVHANRHMIQTSKDAHECSSKLTGSPDCVFEPPM